MRRLLIPKTSLIETRLLHETNHFFLQEQMCCWSFKPNLWPVFFFLQKCQKTISNWVEILSCNEFIFVTREIEKTLIISFSSNKHNSTKFTNSWYSILVELLKHIETEWFASRSKIRLWWVSFCYDGSSKSLSREY